MLDRASGLMRAGACAVSALTLVIGNAFAAAAPGDYPKRPIRVVVPSLAGGPPDLIIRMLAPKLVASLGQQLVVDNRAGAGGGAGAR